MKLYLLTLDIDILLMLWRNSISHPRALDDNLGVKCFNALVDRICRVLVKLKKPYEICAYYVTFIDALDWCTVGTNFHGLIPIVINLIHSVFHVLVKDAISVDVILATVLITERRMNRLLRDGFNLPFTLSNAMGKGGNMEKKIVFLRKIWVNAARLLCDAIHHGDHAEKDNPISRSGRTLANLLQIKRVESRIVLAQEEPGGSVRMTEANRKLNVETNALDLTIDADDAEFVKLYMSSEDPKTSLSGKKIVMPLGGYLEVLSCILSQHMKPNNSMIVTEMDDFLEVESVDRKYAQRVILANRHYLMDNVDKTIRYHQKLGMKSASALFSIHIARYDLASAMSIVLRQLHPGLAQEVFTIWSSAQGGNSDLLRRSDGNVFVDESNLIVVTALVTLLDQVVQFSTRTEAHFPSLYVLSPLFCQHSGSNPLILPEIDSKLNSSLRHSTRDPCYYLPLQWSMMETSAESLFRGNWNQCKNAIMWFWMALDRPEEAVRCCLQYKLWHNAVDILLRIIKRDDHANENLATSFERIFSDILQNSILENDMRLASKLLHMINMFSPDIGLRLRQEAIDNCLRRTQSQLQRAIPCFLTRDKSSLPARGNTMSLPEKLRLAINAIQQRVPLAAFLRMQPDDDDHNSGGVTSMLQQHQYDLLTNIAEMLLLFAHTETAVPRLIALYRGTSSPSAKNNNNTNDKIGIFLEEFRFICRYLWYIYLVDSIQEGFSVSKPFRSVYRPRSMERPISDATIQRREKKLIVAAQSCGALLDFEELHSKTLLQGTMLTMLSMLRSHDIIVDLLMEHMPDDELVADSLRSKLRRLHERLENEDIQQYERLNILKQRKIDQEPEAQTANQPSESGSDSDSATKATRRLSQLFGQKLQLTGWKCEHNPEYWKFLDNVMERVSESLLIQQAKSNAKFGLISETVKAVSSPLEEEEEYLMNLAEQSSGHQTSLESSLSISNASHISLIQSEHGSPKSDAISFVSQPEKLMQRRRELERERSTSSASNISNVSNSPSWSTTSPKRTSLSSHSSVSSISSTISKSTAKELAAKLAKKERERTKQGKGLMGLIKSLSFKSDSTSDSVESIEIVETYEAIKSARQTPRRSLRMQQQAREKAQKEHQKQDREIQMQYMQLQNVVKQNMQMETKYSSRRITDPVKKRTAAENIQLSKNQNSSAGHKSQQEHNRSTAEADDENGTCQIVDI